MQLSDTERDTLKWASRFVPAHIDRAGLVDLLTGTGADHQLGGPLKDRDPGMMRAELIGVAQSRVAALLSIIDKLSPDTERVWCERHPGRHVATIDCQYPHNAGHDPVTA